MTVKRIVYLALGLGTAVIAGLIYLQSPLGGVCVGVLAAVIAFGVFLDRHHRRQETGDDLDSRKAALRGVAARSMQQRERGESPDIL